MSPSPARLGAEWDDATAGRVARIGEWDRLFERLGAAGCDLGVEGRMRVLGLVGRLAAAGADLDDAAVLQAHLLPILASGPSEPAEIAELIADWRRQASSAAAGDRRDGVAAVAPPDPIAAVLHADRRSRPWLALGAILLLVLGLGIALGVLWQVGWLASLLASGGGASTAPATGLPGLPSGADWQARAADLAIGASFALPVLLFGYLLLGWRSAAGDRLVRRAGQADWSELFALAAERVRWFAVGDPRRLFEMLKQPKLQTVPGRIDVPASVRATLRAGMAPVIELQSAAERPNYVVLVDRRGAGDHVQLLLQALTEALRAARIRFAQYEFRGRPALCTPASAEPGSANLRLAIVAKRHAGERLLLISDGENLFETPGWRILRGRRRMFVRPGTPVPEMKNLRDFSDAVLLTPTPRAAWGAREQMLRDLGLLVVAADAEGILRIGQYIARGGEDFAEPVATSAADDPFIVQLSARALRYSGDVPPPLEEIANLVMDIRIWLARTAGDERLRAGRAFLVLCGVAAFPTIAPGLTVAIARLLSRVWGEADAPVDSRLLEPLARLPWLRDGRMPDWLRIALLNALDDADFNRVRALQFAVLGAANPISGVIDAAGLERIAAELEVAVGTPGPELDEAASHVATSAPGDEIERIFLAVLHGERLDPVRDVIAPEAPAAMRERLTRPERRRRAAVVAATIVAAAVVVLAEPIVEGWIAAGWLAVKAFSEAHPTSLKLAGFDMVPWLGGPLALASGAGLAIWLVTALRPQASLEWRQRSLGRLRYWALLPAALTAAYVLAAPDAGRLPLLFAWAAAIFLWFAPASRSPGARSAADVLPQRLEGDDWIAKSLGSVVVAIASLGPVFVFALPAAVSQPANLSHQLAAVLVGATSWGLGSRYVRRHLLGPVEGRPTANERWLDFIAPLLPLLFIAAVMPTLTQLRVTSDPTVYFWFLLPTVVGLIGLLLAFLTLRITLERSTLLLYIIVWSMSLIAFMICLVVILNRSIDVKGLTFSVLIFLVIFVIMTCSSAILNRHAAVSTIALKGITAAIYCFLLFFASGALWVRLSRFYSSPANDDIYAIFLALVIWAALFWPNLRLFSPDRPAGSVSLSEQTVWRRTLTSLRAAATSPWWIAPLMWAVSLEYTVLDFDIAVAPLAALLAALAGWRWGAAAAVPVLVGALPFIVQLDVWAPVIVTPGGFWPFIVLPMLSRMMGDDAVRSRVLGRERASSWDGAVLALCVLATLPQARLDPTLALSVDPSWLALAAGFLVGASRMRSREPAIAFAVGGVALGLLATRFPVLGLEPWAVSAASFFGGRVWRRLLLPGTAGSGEIALVFANLLMICAAGGAYLADVNRIGGLPPVTEILPRDAPLLLLALVGGIAVRRSIRVALAAWLIAASLLGAALVMGPGFGRVPMDLLAIVQVASASVICLVAFALFGHQLDKRGEAAYARALGLIPQPATRQSSPTGDADRGSATRGDVGERAVA